MMDANKIVEDVVGILREVYGDDLLAVVLYEIGELPPKKLGLLIVTKRLRSTLPLEEFVIVKQTLKARLPYLPVEDMLLSVMTESQLSDYRKSPVWKEIKRGKLAAWDPHKVLRKLV